MTIYGLNMDGLGTDTRQAQVRRALLGALYGLLGGLAFVLMASFIDLWLYPDLPLTVDWATLRARLPLISLGLALVGAVTAWWHEAWQGLLSGAVLTAVLALLVALFTSQVGTGLKFIVLLFILVPVAAMTLPIAYFLRWLTERHARSLHQPRAALRVLGLLLLVVAVGAGLGYLMKSSARAITSARLIHGFLQDPAAPKNPLAKVAGVPERAGTPYSLYATGSRKGTEAFDIHVQYQDQYRLTCTVILYPGRTPFFSGCEPDGP